jgi:RNA polymerase sigma-70 factor (ECF subfamily)
MTRTDAQLIESYQDGEHSALAELWLKYHKLVYGIAVSIVKSHEDAEDLRQEVFLKVYNNLSNLKEPEKFASWLRTITRNTCKSWLSQHTLSATPIDSIAESDYCVPSCHETFEIKEEQNLLQNLINDLPLDYRTVINLHYFQHQKVREIAEFLSLPESTVKWRIHAARNMLKEKALSNGYVKNE